MRYDIPDDPIISCIQRTGYPPWYFGHGDDYYDEPDPDDEEADDGPEL